MTVRIVLAQTSQAPELELAERLRAGLARLGVEVSLAPLDLGRQAGREIVLAPHRAYEAARAAGGQGAVLAAARGRCHLIMSVPGEPAFERDWPAAVAGRGAITLDPEAARVLRAHGVRAAWLPPAWDEGLVPPAGGSPRVVDVAFFGTLTARRERLLAQLSEALPGCRLEVFARDEHEPLDPDQRGHLWGSQRAAYVARTRIVLDLAAGPLPAPSSLRWMAASHGGAVLVAEAGCALPGVPGIVVATDSLAETLAALLADPARCERLAAEAQGALRAAGTLAERFLGAYEAVAGPALPGPRLLAARLRARARALAEGQVSRWMHRVDRRWLGASKAQLDAFLHEARLEWQTLYLRQLHMERHLVRRIDAWGARLLAGGPDTPAESRSPAWEAAVPDVSVVLTAYNYAGLLGEALASVWASTGVVAEVIVVDDASTDATPEVLSSLLAAQSERPWCVLTHRSNRGLAAARNTGFLVARAPFVFVLDADNRIAPECLSTLRSALQADPEAAFAYGVLRRFGEGAPGLVSAYPWRLPQLIRRNVIDAMALVRREAWAAVGGYRQDMDAEFGGMEDWALWLAFAERGWRGVLVPRVVAEYRTHAGSMTGAMVLNYRLTERILARFPGLAQVVAETPRPGRPPG